jgi:hypothetical protein
MRAKRYNQLGLGIPVNQWQYKLSIPVRRKEEKKEEKPKRQILNLNLHPITKSWE